MKRNIRGAEYGSPVRSVLRGDRWSNPLFYLDYLQAKNKQFMMKIIKILPIILIAFMSINKSYSQEITEENYLKEDKEIWDAYNLQMANISKSFELFPEKKDSLSSTVSEIYKEAQKKNMDTALKYFSVPSGLERIYMLRLNIPKDTLRSILKKLPKKVQESEYRQSIKFYIDYEQIEEGDYYYNFQATDSNGKSFKLSDLQGKNILLLYGGLGCMRESGRSFLKNFHERMSKDDFKIVVFYSSDDIVELKKIKDHYQMDFIFVSDFKKDHSPMKIIYGVQTTPTCFIINENGKITKKSIGLPEKELNKIKASR